MNKKNYWIGFALSVLFLFLFFRRTDLRELWNAFRSVNYLYTVPIMLVNVFTIFVRAVRWRLLLRPIKAVGLPDLFKATAIGFMANNLFPARIGELVRAFVLGERARISKTASLATIVVERLFDGFAILLLFLVVILFMPFPAHQVKVLNPQQIKAVGWLSLVFYTGVLTVLMLLRFRPGPMDRLIDFCLKPLPERWARRLREMIHSFVSGLEILQRKKDMLIVMAYSLFMWIVLSLAVYLLVLAFDLRLTVLEAFFIEMVLIFGVAIPSAPGFIGTFHWACAAALMFLGVDPSPAKTFAIIFWLCYFLPITGLGILVLWQEGMTLNKIKSEIRNSKSESH